MQDTPHFDERTPRRGHMWRRVFLLLPFVVLVLSTRGAESRAPGPARQAPWADSFPSAQFAIGDFDGDVRPDFATVQGGSNSSGDTNYRIQLHLTTAGPQFISLVAPAGGLWIEARDVNGDHAIDLILSTAWLKQPVAIFLNDGHGRFSRKEPKSFPAAFHVDGTGWRSASQETNDALGIPASSNTSPYLLMHNGTPPPLLSTVCVAAGVTPSDLRPDSHSGRAPPSGILVS